MPKTYSLSDIPCRAEDKDEFGINPFAKGLERFITNTGTPITIALQGEWGSGKTSLMNYLQESLCNNNSRDSYHGVWINTWEYALMKDPATTLMQIITQMAAQTASNDSNRRKDVLDKVKKFGVVALKTAVNAGLGGGSEELNALFDSPKSSIGKLRDELQESINTTLAESHKKGFVFFIDDLDRINPPTAVELLELLKNIFTLDKCVFVLAIDYDVVVKGLKPKFGELTDQNEREFRSFFDKIIQVPFSMPVSNYRIDSFLKESLFNIGWVNNVQRNTKPLMERIAEAARLSVGHNPRSLKRLLNNLSLIKCINDTQNSGEEELLKDDLFVYLSFALVSLQIAYPKIYNVLNKYPCFTMWNEDIAFQLNLETLDDDTKQGLMSLTEFDEDWEQMLYRICASDYYLKHKALNISQLLNSMREVIKTTVAQPQAKDNSDKIANEDPKQIEDNIRWAMRMSAITNLEANDTAPVNYHTSSFLKEVRNRLIASLKNALPQYASIIAPNSARVQTNAPIKLTPKVELNMHTYSDKGKIRLNLEMKIFGNCECSQYKTVLQYIEERQQTAQFKVVEEEYEQVVRKYSQHRTDCYESHSLLEIPFSYYKDHYLMLRFSVLFPTTEDFMGEQVIADMTEMVCAMLTARQRMDEMLGNN